MGLLTPLAVRIGALEFMPNYLPQIVATDRALQKVTRGRVTILDIAGLPNLTLTVIGRKSGQPRSTPLLAVPRGGDWLIAGSNFGGPKQPVWVVNIETGATVGFLRFDDLVQEIFEVTLLPGLRFPEIAEPHSETVANGFVLAPPPSSPVPRPDGGRA